MIVSSLLHVNTSVASNNFVPVPISSVAPQESPYDRIYMLNEINFYDLNSPRRMNYSSFDQRYGVSDTLSDRNENITQAAVRNGDTEFNFENPFKIPKEELEKFNRYENALTYTMTQKLSSWEVQQGSLTSYEQHIAFVHPIVVRSLFNPYLAINVKGMTENVPLLNEPYGSRKESADNDAKEGFTESQPNNFNIDRYDNNYLFDTSDCSIRTLVKLSKEDQNGQPVDTLGTVTETTEDGKKVKHVSGRKHSVLGRGIYNYADFMFCKDLGKVSNNYLITLRRFPHPIGDNITNFIGTESDDNDGDLNIAPDVGRMVCWLGDDNKLEDILKFSFKDSFVQKEGDFDERDSKEGDPGRGLIGQITNLANPRYRAGLKRGQWGGENGILNTLVGNGGSGSLGILSSEGTYENDSDAKEVLEGRRYDRNKVYYPKGIIRDTHLYEGRLTFNNEFALVFEYELRAYENINPKTAFLDLIGNILKVTYRNGKFWGGENRVYGIPGNEAGWKLANSIIDGTIEKVSDFANNFAAGNVDMTSLMGKIGNSLKGVVEGLANLNLNDALNKMKSIGTSDAGNGKTVASEFVEVLGGMFKNVVGRPAIYAFQSILKGDPVGLWHVTIGNPRNPIASMGNMIIDSTSFQQYGPLGIDDFPTGIKVIVNLKHARSRDASEITHMYTKGIGGTHMYPRMSLPSLYYEGNEAFGLFGTNNPVMIDIAHAN